MALRVGHPEIALLALDALEADHLTWNRYREAEAVVIRRLEVTASVEDPVERGDTFAMAAWHAFHIGRYADAARYGDEGYRVTAADIVTESTHCLSWRALARFRLGDWNGFLGDLAREEEILGDRRDTPMAGVSRPWPVAALVHELQGDSATADRYFGIVERLGEARGRPLGTATPWIARMLALRGAFEESLRLVDLDLSARGTPEGSALLYEASCDVVAEAGEWGRARDVVETARCLAAEGGLLALPYFADRLEGRAALAAGQGESAVRLLERATRGFESLGARWEGAYTELALTEALALTGDHEAARGRLADATDVFEDLSSVRELARARELGERLVD